MNYLVSLCLWETKRDLVVSIKKFRVNFTLAYLKLKNVIMFMKFYFIAREHTHTQGILSATSFEQKGSNGYLSSLFLEHIEK